MWRREIADVHPGNTPMRLLVVLLLIAAGPARAQTVPDSASMPESITVQTLGDEVVSSPSLSGPEAAAHRAGSFGIREHEPSNAIAQRTMSNFLYQVLLAAVTALVTALIWKWVF